ncbi:MAG: hypothetical protein IAG13_00485 [Deltaproteobacteria bacterium]|nr:hypothetical protein [Nannocystaceae bacterium]
MNRKRSIAVLGLMACGSLGGCADAGGQETDASSSSSASSSSEIGYPEPEPTTAPGTTLPGSTSEGSSSEDEGSTGEPEACAEVGISSCDPSEVLDYADVEWSVESFGGQIEDLDDVDCVVLERHDADAYTSLRLECPSASGAFQGVRLPAVPGTTLLPELVVATPVRLDRRVRFLPYINEWFTLRDVDGQLLAAGVSGSELVHPELPELLAPLQLTMVDGLCEAECLGFRSTGNPTEVRRVAIEAQVAGASLQIADGNAAQVGDTPRFGVMVGESFACLSGLSCEANYKAAWFELFVYAAAPA